MAKRKATINQKDFALGETRPDSLERDDTDLLNRALKKAQNTMILSTGAISERPGSFHLVTTTGKNGYEIEPEDGLRLVVVPVTSGLKIYRSDGTEFASFTGAPWTLDEDIWVTPLGDTVLMGSLTSATQALVYDDGAFTFGAYTFASGVGGSLNQPYYAYEPEITLTPSGLTGSITLTTDIDFFNATYVGQRIRYVEREILITAVTDGKNASGTVQQELAPTKVITVADSSGFLVDQSVEHQSLGGQGIITGIAGNNITVLVTKFFTGFDGISSNLVGPDSQSNITAQVDAGSPAGTKLWDEPLVSPTRGYPGSCVEHAGRVVLNDFPQAPNVIALSATGTLNDFKVGTNDDDAIVDTISANSSVRILHCVSAEDLVILTSRGCFYQETRDGEPLTPANFDPVKFDDMGASRTRPSQVHDGVVFSAVNGQNIFGAILQGDIYKAWTLVPLSDYHNHLISSPTRIRATNNDSDRSERFIFVVNNDGTAAIMRWERGPAFSSDTVGWVPWTTRGSYQDIFMAFGKIHAITSRTIDNTSVNFLEKHDEAAFLDAASLFEGGVFAAIADENGEVIADENGIEIGIGTAGASHLGSETVTVFASDYDMGEMTIGANGAPEKDGAVPTFPAGDVQAGFAIDTQITPWSRRSVENNFGRREAKRIIRLSVGVYNSLQFKLNGKRVGGYVTGDDLASPPSRRTDHYHVYPSTRKAYQDIPIVKDRPGPLTITTLQYRVQV